MWVLIAVGLALKALAWAMRGDFFSGDVRPSIPSAELVLPRVEEGTPLPLFFGTVRVRAPILAATFGLYSDYAVYDGVTVDRWTAHFMYVIGMPLPSVNVTLREILIGGRKVTTAVQGTFMMVNSGSRFADNYMFLGGPRLGGGIRGTIEFRGGSDPAQTWVGSSHEAAWKTTSNPLNDPTASLLPGYRGQATVALTSWRFGERPLMDPYDFIISADCAAASLGGYAPINNDANPMAVLRGLLTSPWPGLGHDVSVIDTASFDAVAATLASELNGCSHIVYDRTEAVRVINDILSQTECSLYRDRTDGKFHVKAIRNDYDPNTIPVLDASNVERVVRWEETALQNAPNEVVVKYVRRNGVVDIETAPASTPAQNLASITTNGNRIRSIVHSYLMCSNQVLAAHLAARDLEVVSTPLFIAQLAMDQSAYKLNPGDPVKWIWPEYGWPAGVLVRVIDVEHGPLLDDRVLVTIVLDRFGVDYGLSDNPPETGFGDELVYVPIPITQYAVQEAPQLLATFAMFNQFILNNQNQRLYALWANPGLALGDQSAHSEVDQAGGVVIQDMGARSYGGWATVETAFPRTRDPYVTVATDGLRVTNLTGLALATATATEIRQRGRNLLYCAGEWLSFESFTDLGGSPKVWRLENVWRGLMDTAPVILPVGAPVFFADDLQWLGVGRHIGSALFDDQPGTVEKVRLIPHTNGAVMAGNRARQISVPAIKTRWRTPMPVADLTANGAKSIASLAEEGLTLAWKRRAGSNQVVRGDAAAMTLPTSYTFRPMGKKLGVEAQLLAADLASTADGTLATAVVPLGAIGHGTVDAAVRTLADVEIVDSISSFASWQDPAVSVVAERWRNLLLNPRFGDGTLNNWTIVSGAPQIGSTAATALGGAGKYVEASSVAAWSISQKRSIAGYVGSGGTGLAVVVGFYGRLTPGAGAADSLTVTLDLLNDADGVVATATYGPTAQSNAFWKYNEVAVAVTAATKKFNITVTSTANGGLKVTELTARCGQYTAQLVANGSFQAALASWTTVSGAWRTGLTAANIYEDTVYIGGGTAAADELSQDLTVPAGYEADATAVFEIGTTRDGADTDDTGEVIVEARDAGGLLTSATTGTYTPATNLVWERKRVVLDLPIGTTIVRIRLRAVRVTDAGDANICFDDASCRIHKTLDRNFTDEQTAAFLAPVSSAIPRNLEDWIYEYPTMLAYPYYGAWYLNDAQGTRGTEPIMTDGGVTFTSRFMGPYNAFRGTAIHNAARFPGGAAAAHLSADGDYLYARSEQLWCLAWVRVDARDHGATAREIIGCKGTRGWELTTTAAGLVKAKIWGELGNAEVTSVAAINDGRPHLVGLSYAVGGSIKVYVDGVVASASAAGTGTVKPPANEATWFRIGRSTSGGNGVPGQIAGAYLGLQPLPTDAEIAAMWTHGADPSAGTAGASTISGGNHGAVVVTDALGLIGVTRMASGKHPIAWDVVSAKWGLALSKSVTNAATTQDFANAAWTTVGAPTWTTSGIEDVEGWLRGARLVGDNTKYARYDYNAIPSSPVQLVFFARARTATTTMRVELVDDTPIVLDTETHALTGAWKRIDCDLDWSAHGTANGGIRIYASNTGSSGDIEISGPFVVHHSSGAIPIVLPYEGQVTAGNQLATLTTAMTAAFNYGGQITTLGRATVDAGTYGTLVNVKNASNDNNRRHLQLKSATTEAEFIHYDGTATAVASEKTNGAGVLNAEWKIEARWSRAGTIDDAAAFAGVELNDAKDYDRVAAFSVTTVAPTAATLGITSDMPNVFLRSVHICHREILA